MPASSTKPTHPTSRLFDSLRELAAEAPISVRVSGDCMAPLLRDGVRIEIRARRLYLPGDLIAFAGARDTLFVHRFLGYAWARRWVLLTQADSAPHRDAPLDPLRVLGRICGGDVSNRAIAVPLADRLRATWLWWTWCARGLRGFIP